MKILKNINQILTLKSCYKKDGRNLVESDLDIISNGAIIFDDLRIIWVGKTNDIPVQYKNLPFQDLNGHVITPEIVDSHTHLVFSGNRSNEYAMRLNGKSYEQIAQAGGGILYTAQQTQTTNEIDLFEISKIRIEKMFNQGIGTIEIKTGYGLNEKTEIILAQVISQLKKYFYPRVQIYCTYLAAHAVPAGYTSSSYLDEIVIPTLEKLQKDHLIDFVDIFHEKNYFSDQDLIKLFDVADKYQIGKRIHADELNDNHGAKLAAKYHCLSADHLLQINEEGIKSLAQSKTVATLLPGTAFFLGKQLAPARKLLDAGVKVSLASDFNPGSCHIDNLLLIANMSAPTLKLNQAELWCSITLNPAHSLGLFNQGIIAEGFRPRFTVFKTANINELSYNWTTNFCIRN